MVDLNVQIGTQGDVTGLKKMEAGYQSLIDKSKQAYKTFQERSPMQAAADRQLLDRKMGDLERKANDIERKITSQKLERAEGVFSPGSSPGYEQKLREELEQVKLKRKMGGYQQELYASQAEASRTGGMGFLGPMGKFGSVTKKRVLKYGGAIAGIAGAYSLISNIAGEMGTAEEMNQAYAGALSATRGTHGFDYESKAGFYDVQSVLKELGTTAYMTSKEMIPLLDVARELGDFSGGKSGTTGGRMAVTANIGAALGVDSSAISELLKGGYRSGGFERGVRGETQANDMAKMMMLNANMMNRATESIQSMNQVMSGTAHGTQGLGAFNMFNMLDTLNSSDFLAYRGQGGANAMLRMDQAFRGGGNENFQYFQNLALNPAFQERNKRRVTEWGASKGGSTDYGTGNYDQMIADVFKDLGAYATPADVMEQLTQMKFTGAAQYVGEKYSGTMGKTNIERTFDQYRSAYGSKNEGKRLFMTSQLAKDMGVSFSDVGVLDRAFQNKDFMKRAREGELNPEEMAEMMRKFEKSGGVMPDMEAYKQAKADAKEANIKMAGSIKKMADDLLPLFIPLLETMAEYLPLLTDGVVTLAGKIEEFVNIFTADAPPDGTADEIIPEVAKEDIKNYQRLARGLQKKKSVNPAAIYSMGQIGSYDIGTMPYTLPPLSESGKQLSEKSSAIASEAINWLAGILKEANSHLVSGGEDGTGKIVKAIKGNVPQVQPNNGTIIVEQ